MTKLTAKFDAKHNAMVFVDANDKEIGKPEKLCRAIGITAALACVNREFTQRESVAQSTVSLMLAMLDDPKFSGWAACVGPFDNVPSELKEAVRDAEVVNYKPDFIKALKKPGDDGGEGQWQAFRADLRKGGSYAQAKGKILQYFAVTGELPCLYVEGMPQKDKQYTVACIEKMLAQLKADAVKPASDSIAFKIMQLAAIVDKRTTDKKGNPTVILTDGEYGNASAIAALKALLATFEGEYRLEIDAQADAKQTEREAGLMQSANDAIHAAKGVAQPAKAAMNDAQVTHGMNFLQEQINAAKALHAEIVKS
jgi:hypothetical protein